MSEIIIPYEDRSKDYGEVDFLSTPERTRYRDARTAERASARRAKQVRIEKSASLPPSPTGYNR